MNHFFRGLITHYGLPAAVLLLVVENMGIPLPTEIVYVIAQGLIIRGEYSYLTISILFLFAHLLGSGISYFIGLRIARGLHQAKEVSGIQKKLAGWYQKHGELAVFFARMVGQFRPWSSYVAGTAEMPVAPFLIATAVGSALFNALALALTGTIIHYSSQHAWFAAIVGVSFSAGIIAAIFAEVQTLVRKRKNKDVEKKEDTD